TFALKAGVWFRRGRLLIISPVQQPSWLLSGRNPTYPVVQILQATSIAWFAALGMVVTRIGLEAGPLSQWLYAEMKAAGLEVELLETRHVRDAFKAMPVKTDRKDARGIAQLMRLGWFRPGSLQVVAGPGGAGAADHA